MAGDVQEKLKLGIEAARRGDKRAAQVLLREVVAAAPDNELAWMWLASAVESLDERRSCLQNALRLNPDNTRAREALRRLDPDNPPKRRPPAPASNRQEGGGPSPVLLFVAGIVVLAVITALIFTLVSLQQPPAPSPDEVILALSPTLSPTPNPNTFTATPSPYAIFVTPNVTLPPTFTPTFTPTATETPLPSPTPLPLSFFTMLYTGAETGAASPAMFQAIGDGSSPTRLDAAARDIAYDPSGKKVAFVRAVTATTETGEGESAAVTTSTATELFIAPVDDLGSAVQVTDFGATISRPTWAPNGFQLAFVSDFDGDDDIWTITDDGQNVLKLTDNASIDRDPAWSPDGTTIVYVSDLESPGLTKLYAMSAEGTDPRRLLDLAGNTYSPAWADNGSRLVFINDASGDGDIYISDPDGQRSLLLTADDGGAEDRSPQFTPDGRWVGFVSNRGGDDIFQIYVVDLQGTTLVQLTDDTLDKQEVDFRPELILRLRESHAVSEEQQINDLMREGLEAARSGDRATARDRFTQITELDENNERAWYYLSKVVESEDERRVCLKNVLVINPDNERAREDLENLERKQRARSAAAEVIPGVSRRQLMLIGGGGGAIVAIIVLIFAVAAISNANEEARIRAEGTAVAQAATGTAVAANAEATVIFETQVAAQLLITAIPTRSIPTLPPEFTPSPSPTGTATPEVEPTPPADVAGNIVAFGGVDVLSNGALELYLYAANGGEPTRIGEELGRNVRFTNQGNRVIYTRFFDTTFDFGVETININGSQPQIIRSEQGVLGARQPDHCRSSNLVAFVAVPGDVPRSAEDLSFDTEPARQVYVIDVNAGAGDGAQATRRLTNDTADYSYPAFAPDCSRIVVARDDRDSLQPGVDLVSIAVDNPGDVRPITSDSITYAETTPRFSVDGQWIVFAAAPRTEPNNHDIVIVDANGAGVPQVAMRDASDEIYPVLSPDGRYLAFSSNRQGVYNIFILERASGQLWQLTNGPHDMFMGDWWQ